MTIAEAFSLYRDDVIIPKNQSQSTEEGHFDCMNRLLEFFGDIQIEHLDRSKIRAWRNDLSRGRAPVTVRGYVIKLRNVLSYLTKEGYQVTHIDHIPVPKVKKKAREYVTPNELTAMIDSCDVLHIRVNRVRNKAILALLGSSGLRVEEICRLTINEALLDDFTVSGKSEEPRLCFIDRRARMYIDEYLRLRQIGYSVTSRGRIRSVRKEENDRALFINNLNGNPIKPGDVQEIVRNAAKRVGLTKKVTPKAIRHGFATDLLHRGCDLFSLMKMMGHQSLDTTKEYLHASNPHLKEQYLKYHSVPEAGTTPLEQLTSLTNIEA